MSNVTVREYHFDEFCNRLPLARHLLFFSNLIALIHSGSLWLLCHLIGFYSNSLGLWICLTSYLTKWKSGELTLYFNLLLFDSLRLSCGEFGLGNAHGVWRD